MATSNGLDQKTLIETMCQALFADSRMIGIINQHEILKQFCIIRKKIYKKNSITLQMSLYWLAKYISEFYCKKTVVIVTQYDNQIMRRIDKYLSLGFEDKIKKKDKIQKMIQLINNILSPLVKNSQSFIEKFIMNGSTEALAKHFHGLSSLFVASLGSSLFRYTIGFTYEEISQLADQTVQYIGISSQHTQYKDGLIQDLQSFGGYYTLYNPRHVIEHLKELIRQGYIIEVKNSSQVFSAFNLLKRFDIDMNIYDQLKQIDIKKGIKAKKDINCFSLKEYSLIQDLLNPSLQYFLLIRSGFIVQSNGGWTGEHSITVYNLPNRSMKYRFRIEVLQSWLAKILSTDIYHINLLISSFTTAFWNPIEFKKTLQQKLIHYISKGKKTESDFNGILRGLLELSRLSIRNFAVEIYSQYEIGGKKIDALVVPEKQQKDNYVVVMQYKKIQQWKPDQILQSALWQSFINDYIHVGQKMKKKGKQFSFLAVRAVGFVKRKQDQWIVFVQEYKFKFQSLREISQKFKISVLKQILTQIKFHKKQIEDKHVRTYFLEQGLVARRQFLKRNNVQTLQKFIQPWIKSERESLTIKQQQSKQENDAIENKQPSVQANVNTRSHWKKTKH